MHSFRSRCEVRTLSYKGAERKRRFSTHFYLCLDMTEEKSKCYTPPPYLCLVMTPARYSGRENTPAIGFLRDHAHDGNTKRKNQTKNLNYKVQLEALVGFQTARKREYYEQHKPHKLHQIDNDCMLEHMLRILSPRQIYDMAKRIDRDQDHELANTANEMAEEN